MIFSLKPVVTGPLSQKFQVTHSPKNNWSAGTSGENQGVIAAATKDEAKFLPEGTRLSQSISIYAAKRFGFGDLIARPDGFYKVIHYQDFSDYDYHYGIAVLNNEPSNPDSAGFIDV